MTAEGGYTRISSLLWNWDPFVMLDPTSARLWLCLYTSAPTKRLIPGLWEGSIAAMSSSSKLPADDTIRSLDLLLERELAEYDQHEGLLRLTKLPDAGEWPSNADILRSWWKRFRGAPECAVRDAHVGTIRWLLERGSLESEKNISGKVSDKHEAVWAETFGRIKIPVSRRRGVRRLADHDTSTETQPGLFASKASDATVVDDVRERDVVEPVLPDPKDSKNQIFNTVSPQSGEGEGVGVGDGEFFSSSEEGGSGGDAGGRPHLTLVPPIIEVTMFDITTLTQALQAGLGSRNSFRLNAGQEHALEELVATLAKDGIGDADLPVLSEWLKCGGMRLTNVSPGIYTQIDWWLESDHLARSVRSARVWKTEADERRRDLAQARDQAGV